MNKYFFFLFFFIFDLGYGQDDRIYQSKDGFKISANLLQAGLTIGIEQPIKLKEIEKIKNRKVKTIYREKFNNLNTGIYFIKGFHTNLFLHYQYILRRQKQNGFFYGTLLGGGLTRTLINGTTYKVNQNGEVKKSFLAGNFYICPNIGYEMGYNFNLKYHQPFSLLIKPNLMILTPYNKIVFINPTIEFGLIYHLNVFKKTNLKTEHIIKDKR